MHAIEGLEVCPRDIEHGDDRDRRRMTRRMGMSYRAPEEVYVCVVQRAMKPVRVVSDERQEVVACDSGHEDVHDSERGGACT